MNLNRRKFLFGAGAVVAAPAIAKIQNLMPVKTIQWGKKTLVDVPFDIERITIVARSRQLKATYTFEVEDVVEYNPFINSDMILREENNNILESIKNVFSISRPVRPDLNDPLSALRLPGPTVRSNGILRQFTSRIIGSQRDRIGSEPSGSALPDLRDERSPGELRVLQPKGRSTV